MIATSEDAAYAAVAKLLAVNPTLGRRELENLTGYTEGVCRTRIKRFREKHSAFQHLNKPFPPLSSNPTVRTMLVMNDHHIPFQYNAALKLVHTVAKLAKVDVIALDGDVTDCYEIGRFTQFTKQTLRDEMDQVRTYLQELRIQHPLAEMVYIAGNHEHRWSSYIHKNAPAMTGFGISGLPSSLGLSDLDIKWIYSGQSESYYQVPNTSLFVGHFDRVHKFSCYTVKNLVEDKHVNIIQAHTHRMGTYYKSTIGQQLIGYENGCLRHKSGTEYVMDPNWQLGFSLVYLWGDGSFDVKPQYIHEMENHLFTVYNDQRIEVGIK